MVREHESCKEQAKSKLISKNLSLSLFLNFNWYLIKEEVIRPIAVLLSIIIYDCID